MKIADNIYYRYEKNIDKGVVYIYNFETEILIKSQQLVYQVLNKIDEGVIDEKEIVNSLKKFYKDYDELAILEAVRKSILFLEKNKVIIE